MRLQYTKLPRHKFSTVFMYNVIRHVNYSVRFSTFSFSFSPKLICSQGMQEFQFHRFHSFICDNKCTFQRCRMPSRDNHRLALWGLQNIKETRDTSLEKPVFFDKSTNLQRFFEPKRWFLSKSLNPTNQPLRTTPWAQLITLTVYPKTKSSPKNSCRS